MAAYVFITLKYVPATLSRCKGGYLEANIFALVGYVRWVRDFIISEEQ